MIMKVAMLGKLIIKDHEKQLRQSLRAVKTLFFLITMLFSLLLFSAPVLLIIADSIIPSAILSFSLPPSSHFSLDILSSHLKNYDFRSSLIDIPLLSIVRSSVILCVYCLCDGPRLSRGPYLGITTFCSIASLVFVSLKASYVFCVSNNGVEIRAMDVALVTSSLFFAVGHIVVAYRTSCRERRKLLLYKIDIEAVSACGQKGFPTYNKILQQVRVK